MTENPSAAPHRVAASQPAPANSNRPGARNHDSDGRAVTVEASPTASAAPIAAQDAPAKAGKPRNPSTDAGE